MSDKYFAVFARTDNFAHGRHQKKNNIYYLLGAQQWDLLNRQKAPHRQTVFILFS